jgi:hypothetical protein
MQLPEYCDNTYQKINAIKRKSSPLTWVLTGTSIYSRVDKRVDCWGSAFVATKKNNAPVLRPFSLVKNWHPYAESNCDL